MSLSELWEWWWTGRPGVLWSWGLKESDATEWLNWTELNALVITQHFLIHFSGKIDYWNIRYFNAMIIQSGLENLQSHQNPVKLNKFMANAIQKRKTYLTIKWGREESRLDIALNTLHLRFLWKSCGNIQRDSEGYTCQVQKIWSGQTVYLAIRLKPWLVNETRQDKYRK